MASAFKGERQWLFAHSRSIKLVFSPYVRMETVEGCCFNAETMKMEYASREPCLTCCKLFAHIFYKCEMKGDTHERTTILNQHGWLRGSRALLRWLPVAMCSLLSSLDQPPVLVPGLSEYTSALLGC